MLQWESQSTTPASSATGQRTIHYASRGSRVLPAEWLPGCCLASKWRWRFETRQTGGRTTPATMTTATPQRLTAILYREDEVYVAECPEVGTASQGDTIEEALANLREATELYLEECPQPALAPRLLTTFEVNVA